MSFISTAASFLFLILALFPASESYAGVFDLPSFLDPGKFSVGLEPEIALTNGVGLAGNLKPRYGVNDFLNIELNTGVGLGDRRFRVGGTLDFEWFPDLAGWQPGVATPLTISYLNIDHKDELQFLATPLIYKSFQGGEGVTFTPFLGFPIGWAARESQLRGVAQLAVGSMFQGANMQNLQFVAEMGINIYKSYTYLSGGMVYYFGGFTPAAKGSPSADQSTVSDADEQDAPSPAPVKPKGRIKSSRLQ